jgi:hypothetical protein
MGFLEFSADAWRKKRTSGPEGQLVLSMDVRAEARTYPTAAFFRNLFSP